MPTKLSKEEQLRRALQLLESAQFSAYDGSAMSCPECGNSEHEGHASACLVAATLRGEYPFDESLPWRLVDVRNNPMDDVLPRLLYLLGTASDGLDTPVEDVAARLRLYLLTHYNIVVCGFYRGNASLTAGSDNSG